MAKEPDDLLRGTLDAPDPEDAHLGTPAMAMG